MKKSSTTTSVLLINEFKDSTNNIENYLTRNFIFEYLSDAVEQLLENKNRSLTKSDVIEYFGEYFKNVRKGYHVMFREFKFIMLTPYNRACFVNNFYQAYSYMGYKGETLGIKEYHELISLLCSDFPVYFMQNCQKILSVDSQNDGAYLFKDFIYVLQVQLYYDEFIRESFKIFDGIQQYEAKLATETYDTKENNNQSSRKLSDTINSKSFYESIELLSSKVTYSFPPLTIIKEILSKETRFKFYEFLNRLSKHESINNLIGKLPDKETIVSKEKIEKNAKSLTCLEGITSLVPSLKQSEQQQQQQQNQLNLPPMQTFIRNDTKFASHVPTSVAFNSTIRHEHRRHHHRGEQTNLQQASKTSRISNFRSYNNRESSSGSSTSGESDSSDTYN